MKFLINLSLLSVASAGIFDNNPFSQLAKDIVTDFTKNMRPDLIPKFNDAFDNFTKNFDKQSSSRYMNSEGLAKAKEFFAKSWSKVEEHNERFKLGLSSYSQKIYSFADKDPEVVRSELCGTQLPPTPRALPQLSQPAATTFPKAPAAVDFTNLILGVRNQKSCGSCWAFSTVSMIEAQMKKKTSTYNTLLSPQLLVDCSTNGNAGCNGGWPKTATDYVKANSISTEAAYPYVNANNTCRVTPKVAKPVTLSYQYNLGNNETLMANVLASVGPVAFAAFVTDKFMSYSGGIFEDSTCPTVAPTCKVNHGMVLVGFGYDAILKKNFWKVLNSWGPTWGEAGYIRIARNSPNNCNVACYAMYGKP